MIIDVLQCTASIDFYRFALAGNVLDLAIGIIISAAFSNLVESLVEDVLTPPFGLLLGGIDFSDLAIQMVNFVYTDQPPVVIRYGKFIQKLIYLLILSFVLFFVIKAINKLRQVANQKKSDEERSRKQEQTEELKVLLEIRNILAWKSKISDEIKF